MPGTARVPIRRGGAFADRHDAFDPAQAIEEPVAFDDTGPESAFPRRSRRTVPVVVAPHMATPDGLHEARQGRRLAGRGEQAHFGGEQAVAVQCDAAVVHRGGGRLAPGAPIRTVMEHDAADPGAVHDQVQFTGRDEAGETGQSKGGGCRGSQEGRRLSQRGAAAAARTYSDVMSQPASPGLHTRSRPAGLSTMRFVSVALVMSSALVGGKLPLVRRRKPEPLKLM